MGRDFVRDRQNATTVRVSVATNGALGNSYSSSPSISADGRYVTFQSFASTLAPGDGNGASDVFVRDRQSATLRVVSRLRLPSEAAGSAEYICCDEGSTGPSISDDGRYVAFVSDAHSLLLPDTDPPVFDDDAARTKVYVRDLVTQETVRLPRGSIQNNAVISGNGRYVAYTDWAVDGIQVWDRLTGVSNVRVLNGYYNPRISDDGRFLAYYDFASDNLVVHDSQSGQLDPVNVNSAEVLANDWADRAEISGNGRFVGYISAATNLVANDTNGVWDVFLRDRQARTTERISLSSAGAQANDASYWVDFSDDGRYVAFSSDATNLAPGDTNGEYDVFVRDRQTQQTTRVLVNGQRLGNWTFSMTSDGRYIAVSTSTALMADDTNGASDVYVIDWRTGKAERMSVSSSGVQGNNRSHLEQISGNGRFVVFNSYASNLGAVDLNQKMDVYVHERAVSSLTLSPRSLAFGNQLINSVSAARAVTVTNTSDAAVPITSVALSGAQAGQFGRSHNCGTSLAAGASCTVSVIFKPTSSGAKSAILSVNGTGGGLRTVDLTGTGVTASATYTVSPSSLSFGSRAVGTTSPAKIVTVHNTGSVALPLNGIVLGGTNPGQFARTTNCGASLAAGASCTVSIVFKPTSKGLKSATLVVTPGGGAAPKSVALSGTGT